MDDRIDSPEMCHKKLGDLATRRFFCWNSNKWFRLGYALRAKSFVVNQLDKKPNVCVYAYVFVYLCMRVFVPSSINKYCILSSNLARKIISRYRRGSSGSLEDTVVLCQWQLCSLPISSYSSSYPIPSSGNWCVLPLATRSSSSPHPSAPSRQIHNRQTTG